jgi:hypothetical protein
MLTAGHYAELAAHYSNAAEATSDSFSRYQLLMLADNYATLAKSALVLKRSGKLLEAIEQHRKK